MASAARGEDEPGDVESALRLVLAMGVECRPTSLVRSFEVGHQQFLLFLMWPRVLAQKVQKVEAAGDGAGNHGGRREQGR
jgi:hypothetical protein